jgi:hypothetical protein
MIRIVARWLGPRKLRVVGDSGYAGGSISRHLPGNTELISRMTMNGALYELPPLRTDDRRRRRKKGARLSNPLRMAQDSHPPPGSKPPCIYMGVTSGFGISPSTRYDIPAPGPDCCVSSWSTTPVVAAATTASSPPTSLL